MKPAADWAGDRKASSRATMALRNSSLRSSSRRPVLLKAVPNPSAVTSSVGTATRTPSANDRKVRMRRRRYGRSSDGNGRRRAISRRRTELPPPRPGKPVLVEGASGHGGPPEDDPTLHPPPDGAHLRARGEARHLARRRARRRRGDGRPRPRAGRCGRTPQGPCRGRALAPDRSFTRGRDRRPDPPPASAPAGSASGAAPPSPPPRRDRLPDPRRGGLRRGRALPPPRPDLL